MKRQHLQCIELLAYLVASLLIAPNSWAIGETTDERIAAVGSTITREIVIDERERQLNAQHRTRREYVGPGEMERDEYIIVDLTGSVTRSFCPYSCEERSLERSHCQTWQSIQDPSQCYVRDTRIPSGAIPGFGSTAR